MPPERRKEMATEALDRLRRFSCAKSCTEKIAALGMRCDDFSHCDDCAEARARAASALLDEVEKRLVPEGMEWPRFEDGEPVRIGDEVLGKHGEHEPASEEFAYMVQSIAVGIVLACEKGDDR